MSRKVFQRVGSLRPGRSVFNLSYEKKFSCDMGQLIPVMCDEVIPGDYFKIGNQAVIRFQPLVAPVMHEVNVYVHYFFVPYRILWDDWETFITGGVDGDDETSPPEWNPQNPTGIAEGSLWDYMGFPTEVMPAGAYPLDFPRLAYNRIYDEYYRDQTLQDELPADAEEIQNRCWERDYFSSSLPWQQRGTSPSLPVTISGDTSAVWESSTFLNNSGSITLANAIGVNTNNPGIDTILASNANAVDNIEGAFNDNTVSLDDAVATAFDISDLRLAFQIQKFLERNARAGARYVEFLQAHFGVSPKDERLNRPEYFGGSKNPVLMSEVLQTSSTDATSPQGNLAGHGIAVSDAYCGKYRATEFGLIMGIMSVMPRAQYQQGINRQWLRRTRYDFYFPEFANLSEQAIENAEIYVTDANATVNQGIFGYQGRYDEMRSKNNLTCGLLRDDYDYWHLGRIFGSLPVLNTSFVKCVPSKRIFAATDEPGLIVQFGNIIKAVRPIPKHAEPGLIDHN